MNPATIKNEDYIKIYCRDLFNTIGFHQSQSCKQWNQYGIESFNSGFDDDFNSSGQRGDFVVFQIIDRQKFIWTCLQYEINFFLL